MIDKYNQVRQSELGLEKRWLTQNPYFRLHTTIIGFNVVDFYKLAEHHDGINHCIPNQDFKMTMTSFAGVLANQLMNNVDCLLSFYSPQSQELQSLSETPVNITVSITVSNATQESISSTSTLTAEQLALSLRVLEDSNGLKHQSNSIRNRRR
jgi:hypothetical protein